MYRAKGSHIPEDLALGLGGLRLHEREGLTHLNHTHTSQIGAGERVRMTHQKKEEHLTSITLKSMDIF